MPCSNSIYSIWIFKENRQMTLVHSSKSQIKLFCLGMSYIAKVMCRHALHPFKLLISSNVVHINASFLLTFSVMCLSCQAIKAENIDTITVHFQKNAYMIDETYQNNRHSIHFVDSIIRTSTVNKIVINSSTSPDGKSLFNKELSIKRLHALKDFLVSRYPHVESKIVENTAYSQSWKDILPEIEDHSRYLQGYNETMVILYDQQKDDFSKQMSLKNGPYSDDYAYIAQKILPQGRYVQCILFSDTISCKHDESEYEVNKEDTTIHVPVLVAENEPLQQKPVRWSITTNLLHWAALAHNVGVEYAINSNNTIGLSGSCAWFSNKSKHKVYRWMVGELSYHHYFRTHEAPLGGFVGLYAQTGEFEMMFSPRNRKGEFTSGGICGGYRWQIKKKLFVEAEAGVGYMYIDYRHALDINGVLIRQGRNYRNYVLPSRLAVSLIYRLDKNK